MKRSDFIKSLIVSPLVVTAAVKGISKKKDDPTFFSEKVQFYSDQHITKIDLDSLGILVDIDLKLNKNCFFSHTLYITRSGGDDININILDPLKRMIKVDNEEYNVGSVTVTLVGGDKIFEISIMQLEDFVFINLI
jgi:hypothetical protein